MANKTLFGKTSTLPVADTFNAAGGKAYTMSAKHALAQYVCTSCLNGTFYTSAKAQLEEIERLAVQVEPLYLAKVAVYGHKYSLMKDVPALCCAILAGKDNKLLAKIWDKVIDNGKMLRNFVQIVRSGRYSRKSFAGNGTLKKLVQKWFDDHSAAAIFHQSIGNDPTMADVIKLCHVKPNDKEKVALFIYLCGGEADAGVLRTYYRDKKTGERKVFHETSWHDLPEIVKQFERWKGDKSLPVPKLNFRFLDGSGLDDAGWKEVARNANFETTLKNLNTYGEHNVYDNKEVLNLVADRIGSEESVSKARIFPYQIMMAYLATDAKGVVPSKLKNALQDGMEHAVKNVPSLEGKKVYVCPDVSGSMGSPVTGYREHDTSSKVRCIDVAALISACMLRNNPEAEVIPFEQSVVNLKLNPRDSIMTNATKLAGVGGGGTNCSAPLALLNSRGAKGDLVVFVSDYESWVDSNYNSATGMMHEWKTFKKRNPQARMVCIDLTPRSNTQMTEHEDILQVGGFSDQVFNVINSFTEGGWSKDHWASIIDGVEI